MLANVVVPTTIQSNTVTAFAVGLVVFILFRLFLKRESDKIYRKPALETTKE